MTDRTRFVGNPRGVVDAIYNNPALQKATDKVGKAIVAEARNTLRATNSGEATKVAARVVYKSPDQGGKKTVGTPAVIRELGGNRAVKQSVPFTVGVVGSNHPLTLLWHYGTSSRPRPATNFLGAAMKSVSVAQKLKMSRGAPWKPARKPKGRRK